MTARSLRVDNGTSRTALVLYALLALGAGACQPSRSPAKHESSTPAAGTGAASELPSVAVAPQYDTVHVYVPSGDVDTFAKSFLATFGGRSTKQVVVTVTPTPSTTTSQLLQTPVGTVSLFGFKTPIPAPFGAERTGYLVTDLDVALSAARAAGADVIVEAFSDPIGRDAIIQWPGGVNMQLYWHTTKPSYPAFESVPENRVYVSKDRANDFVHGFARFARAAVTSDDEHSPGAEIGRPSETCRRIQLESAFGKMVVFVTDGHLPYPYGREVIGYEVRDLPATLSKAREAGVQVIVEPRVVGNRQTAMLRFPGDYVAEVHAETRVGAVAH